jgi:hypothetical protein
MIYNNVVLESVCATIGGTYFVSWPLEADSWQLTPFDEVGC